MFKNFDLISALCQQLISDAGFPEPLAEKKVMGGYSDNR
jgi:hypothetical protein